ncbi:MAG: nucleotidyltransferase domain-containing protein [Chloroflexi bacterium]|nr:nucleotidyltransferase domain-containing protein [Chloroflexota bacterium]
MITDNRLDELKKIFVKHGVVLAYLFGSQAEGLARPSSDVDIAVLLPADFPRVKYFSARLALINDLTQTLRRNDVDVIILNEATALLAREIVRHGKILYEDEATRPAIDFAVRAISYYLDTEHFRKLALHYLSEDMERYRLKRQSTILREKKNDQA